MAGKSALRTLVCRPTDARSEPKEAGTERNWNVGFCGLTGSQTHPNFPKRSFDRPPFNLTVSRYRVGSSCAQDRVGLKRGRESCHASPAVLGRRSTPVLALDFGEKGEQTVVLIPSHDELCARRQAFHLPERKAGGREVDVICQSGET